MGDIRTFDWDTWNRKVINSTKQFVLQARNSTAGIEIDSGEERVHVIIEHFFASKTEIWTKLPRDCKF